MTDYRDPSSKVGVLGGEKLKRKKSNIKAPKIAVAHDLVTFLYAVELV